jgi:hypothetical protein
MRDGVNITGSYMTAGDGVGIVPYLHQHLLASGSTSVMITQRATNGATVTNLLTGQVPLMVQDYRTRGVSPQLLVYWQGEAETLNPVASEAHKYESNLDTFCRYIWGYYPSCRIVIVKLLMRTNDYGGANNSVAYPTIVTAQETVSNRYSSEITIVDPTSPTTASMSDDVHAAASAAGFGVVAKRIVAALASG